jgi:pyruvate,orthophosphate dikinase
VYDAYRRFVMMFSDVVMDIPKRHFEARFDALKERLGVTQDTDVPADALRELVSEFKHIVRDFGKAVPPTTPTSSWRWRLRRCSARGTTSAP